MYTQKLEMEDGTNRILKMDLEDFAIIDQRLSDWPEKCQLIWKWVHKTPFVMIENVDQQERFMLHWWVGMKHLSVNPKELRTANYWFYHINGNTLDNRSENIGLKIVEKSPYKGANYDKKRGRWKAQLGIKNRVLNLGYYDTPEEAHLAYLQGRNERAAERTYKTKD